MRHSSPRMAADSACGSPAIHAVTKLTEIKVADGRLQAHGGCAHFFFYNGYVGLPRASSMRSSRKTLTYGHAEWTTTSC